MVVDGGGWWWVVVGGGGWVVGGRWWVVGAGNPREPNPQELNETKVDQVAGYDHFL